MDTNASDHVRRIHQRIEDITGFDLEESEPLTVSNYGIGGQDFIHLDCEQPKVSLVSNVFHLIYKAGLVF